MNFMTQRCRIRTLEKSRRKPEKMSVEAVYDAKVQNFLFYKIHKTEFQF